MTKKAMDVVYDLLAWVDPTSIKSMTRHLVKDDKMVKYFVNNRNKLFSKEELVDLGLEYLYEYNNDPPNAKSKKYLIFELREVRYIFKVLERNWLKLFLVSSLGTKP